MTIINLFIKLIISIVITYLILTHYKKIKLNKKYALVIFALGIIQTIILAILNPIEVAIWIYFGIYIITKIKRFKNR